MLKRVFNVLLMFCLVSVSVPFNFVPVANATGNLDRYELDLSGEWSFTPEGMDQTTIQVPDSWERMDKWKDVESATYEKSIEIPAEWADKQITIESAGVNSQAIVSINDDYIGEVSGYKMPFNFDITDKVEASSSVIVTIEVTGGTPLYNDQNKVVYNSGWHGNIRRFGILEPVILKAVPKVSVSDAFIKTSTQLEQVEVEFTVRNKDSVQRTVVLSNEVLDNGTVALEFEDSIAYTIEPNEEIVINVTQPWSDATWWTPDNPKLYHLKTTLKEEDGTVFDISQERFGFREVWIDRSTTPASLYLNGVKFNLRGDSNVLYEQFYFNDYHVWMADKEGVVNVIQEMKKDNMNVMRLHMGPNPKFILEAADEQGMLIIDEYMYGSIGNMDSQSQELLDNVKEFSKQHLLIARNHPSIIMHNASNEVVGYGPNGFGPLSETQMHELIAHLQQYDNTRPYNSDGERGASPDVMNIHYEPGGYANDWPVNNDVYGYLTVPNNNQLWGLGEFLASYLVNKEAGTNKEYTFQETMAMQGIYSRAARYHGYADIRPYRLDWMWQQLPDRRLQTDIVAKSFAPVAVFDHEYDKAGVNPLLLASDYPSYEKGAEVTRTLDIYNDEMSNEHVTVKWYANFNGETIAHDSLDDLEVPLGGHISQNIIFTAPDDDGRLELVIESWKSDQLTFHDTRYFDIGTGTDNIAPRKIVDLYAELPTENTALLRWTAPGDDNDKGTATSYDIRYATTPINEQSWNDATPVVKPVTPDLALTPQAMEISGLNADTLYYFAIKADDGSNISELSTSTSIRTMPAKTNAALSSIADKSSRGDGNSQSNRNIYVKPNHYGNGNAEEIDNSVGYVKFNVSAFDSTERALLKLFHLENTHPGAWNLFVYGLNDTTWNDKSNFVTPIPGVNNGVGIISGEGGTEFITTEPIVAGSVGHYVTIDVSDYVAKKKAEGVEEISFLLYGQPFESELLGSTFSGRETPNQQPKLVVSGDFEVDDIDESVPNKYEAESAVLSNGAEIANTNTGFTGKGYVTGYINNVGASTIFTVNVEEAGKKMLTLRYAAGAGTSNDIGLYVNDEKVNDITFNRTSNWNSWSDKIVVVELEEGNNTIEYRIQSNTPAGINLDYLTVEPARLEAENGFLVGGAMVETEHAGYSGTGFVGGYYSRPGASTTFYLTNTVAGEYDVSLGYANSSGTTEYLGIFVNGEYVKSFTLQNHQSWATWASTNTTLNLLEGLNTIQLKSNSNDPCRCNIDYIELQYLEPTIVESSNADLMELNINNINVSEFNKDTLTYTVQVANTVTSANVTYVVADNYATVVITGGTSLAIGSNVVTVKVTAEDGSEKTYTITVVRADEEEGGSPEESSNADLNELSVNNIGVPAFDKDTLTYTVQVTNRVTSANVTYVVADNNAKAIVTGGTSLAVGSNVVTVKVTAEDGTEKTYTITVIRATASSNNGGGIVSPPLPTTTPVPTTAPVIEPVKQVELVDIQGHWAESAIKRAVSLDIIRGYADETFRPEQSVTRAEFVSMIVRGLNLKGTGAALDFADADLIPKWARVELAIAVEAGIINGYSDSTIRSNQVITRQEMIVMLVRALGLNVDQGSSADFADNASIKAWATTEVALAQKLGIVEGYPGNLFYPDKQASRAEAVTMLLRTLDQK